MSNLKIIFILLLSTVFLPLQAQKRTNPSDQEKELGKVSWYRDYDIAIAKAKEQNKPVLILFQEVPGCATCRNYGHGVLSHPLMTEAIENEFIPLAIFNNKRGKDLEILKKYKEPTWNNPVVRIVNANGENLVKRVAGDYSARGLYRVMVKALEAEGIPIPEYMTLLGKELSYLQNPNIREANFKMYCFWSGEKELGGTHGVLSTKAGFMNGEVVKVKYDTNRISEGELNAFAQSKNMQPVQDNGNFRWAKKDEDYYLQHSKYKYLPLSEVQKTKINSALGYRQPAEQYLSPKQRKWLQHLERSGNKVLYDQEFKKAWEQMSSRNGSNTKL
ncbi:MAG: VPGUxxT family thioredoxin-like (seleno)protein, type 2 [Bacteroidota bacterium]